MGERRPLLRLPAFGTRPIAVASPRRALLRLGLAAAGAVAALAVGPSAAAPGAATAVVAFPSSQTIPGNGSLPAGGAPQIRLNAALGDHEAAWIVARGAGEVSAAVRQGTLGPIRVELAWGHFVSVGSASVPDALLPWDGRPRAPERSNQPLYVRVSVPPGVAPGRYAGAVDVVTGTGAGAAHTIPLNVRVLGFALPEAGTVRGNLLTSFHVSAESYVSAAARLYHFSTNDRRREANTALYRFLSAYRISPSSWGFGEPRTPAGYATSTKWWLDSAGNMESQLAAAQRFAAMRIPVSSNRASAGNRIAGLDPARPEGWCDYLKAVRGFWEQRGWLTGTVQYLYAQDEPSLEGQRLVARQSRIAHDCWPGAKTLMTGNPSPTGANAFLSDGKGGDDLDIWTVLSRRYYGSFTTPGRDTQGRSRARELYTSIDRVRRRASVWSYTYSGPAGTPGFGASEPLSNPRLFLLWNALEGLDGVLYGQGTTRYGTGNPLEGLAQGGEFVLLYPGETEPIPSARLEQIRDGIEDWAIFDALRRRRGPAAVRTILGGAGLFSAGRDGVRLACHLGCELKSATKYSWPAWSADATTPARIEAAKLAALQAVS